jgi:flagellar basal-body rod modification protein FlgD
MSIMSPVAAASNSSNSLSNSLTLQDFLQVLLTQLSFQDPLQPMDNNQFLAQIAQFTALGQTQQTNSDIQILVSNQASQQSIGLIGQTVGVTMGANTISGTVSSVNLSGSTPQLTISTTNGDVTGISLSQITSVG